MRSVRKETEEKGKKEEEISCMRWMRRLWRRIQPIENREEEI